MLKLLVTTLLLSSVLGANQNKLVEDYLEELFDNNPNITSLKVKVVDNLKVDSMKGWEAVVVSVTGVLKQNNKTRNIKQKMVWFTNGEIITKDLTNMRTSESLRDLLNPKFKQSFYKKENLIYGNEDAKHKVVFFSDPLCPFCRSYVPSAINYMKSKPNKFAVYYFHFPLPSIHPAAVELSQAAVAAELKGHKDVVLNMYKVEIDPRERDVNKILKAFNKTMKTDIKPSDLRTKEVMEEFASDMDIADNLMVQGTPTVFFDSKLDRTKKKYQKVK
ncbi:DsbA family protein [Sulfurimonas sp.]